MTAKLIFIVILILAWIDHSQSQNIGGVINSYAPVTAISVNNLQVTLGGNNGLFSACDKVLIIQMQGAQMDTSNTNGYGTILSYGSSGNFEFAYVSGVSANVVTLSSALTRTYFGSCAVQLIKVPVYNNVTVTSLLTCDPWNGSTGGVLVFDACVLTLSANILADGKGFTGGGLLNGTYMPGGHPDYVLSASPSFGAIKGEGIFRMYSTTKFGRGQNSNGGGGGNDVNCGGGGGSNAGEGGTGGNSIDYAAGWPTSTYGGIGGNSLTYNSTNNKVFLGGGGGAGQENDNDGLAGANGGGIIMIHTSKIIGNSFFISANGANVGSSSTLDGQGGGGAGGTILLKYPSAVAISNLQLSVDGGKGGSDVAAGNWYCNGKGGGGGGGIIWTSFALPASVTSNVNGGNAGTFLNAGSPCYGSSFGATNGQSGVVMAGVNFVTGTGACSQSISECPFSNSTGIENYENENWLVSIYPNPSNGNVIIIMSP